MSSILGIWSLSRKNIFQGKDLNWEREREREEGRKKAISEAVIRPASL